MTPIRFVCFISLIIAVICMFFNPYLIFINFIFFIILAVLHRIILKQKIEKLLEIKFQSVLITDMQMMFTELKNKLSSKYDMSVNTNQHSSILIKNKNFIFHLIFNEDLTFSITPSQLCIKNAYSQSKYKFYKSLVKTIRIIAYEVQTILEIN